jgi:hypothetical protein
MEVHGINSYGEDPFVSTGTDIYVKYLPEKSISIDIKKIK